MKNKTASSFIKNHNMNLFAEQPISPQNNFRDCSIKKKDKQYIAVSMSTKKRLIALKNKDISPKNKKCLDVKPFQHQNSQKLSRKSSNNKIPNKISLVSRLNRQNFSIQKIWQDKQKKDLQISNINTEKQKQTKSIPKREAYISLNQQSDNKLLNDSQSHRTPDTKKCASTRTSSSQRKRVTHIFSQRVRQIELNLPITSSVNNHVEKNIQQKKNLLDKISEMQSKLKEIQDEVKIKSISKPEFYSTEKKSGSKKIIFDYDDELSRTMNKQSPFQNKANRQRTRKSVIQLEIAQVNRCQSIAKENSQYLKKILSKQKISISQQCLQHTHNKRMHLKSRKKQPSIKNDIKSPLQLVENKFSSYFDSFRQHCNNQNKREKNIRKQRRYH